MYNVDHLIAALANTVLISLVHGAVVAAWLFALLQVVPKSFSNSRYLASLAAFAVIFVMFFVTLQVQLSTQAFYDSGWFPGIMASAVPEIIPASQFIYTPPNSSVDGGIAAGYTTGLLVMLTRLWGGASRVARMVKYAVGCTDEHTLELFAAAKQKLGMRQVVTLMASIRAAVPMAVGVVKPVVLIPLSVVARLDQKQLEAILLHELAHVRRHDYLVNMLQMSVETLLFFNPFVWLISSRIRIERECACDDVVLQHTSDAITYATALAGVAAPVPGARFTLAACHNSNRLFNRIKRIMEKQSTVSGYNRIVATAMVVAAMGITVAWLPPATARLDEPKSEGVIAKPPATAAAIAAEPDETRLVRMLSEDGLISEVNGFKLEKKDNKLFINQKEVPGTVASKYLNGLTKPNIFYNVLPFQQRINAHPDLNVMQLIAPVTFSSPCVEKPSAKPGC